MVGQRYIVRTFAVTLALVAALWVGGVAAHAGESHGTTTSWTGRLDDLALASGVLLIVGVAYWLANRDRSGSPADERD